MDLYTGIALAPTDEACEREQQEALNPTLPMVAATCPACEGHNISDATGRGVCGDCGLSDNLSGFMGAGMTTRATFLPSKFANQRVAGDARKVRAFTISGGVD